ncbi:MAG: CotH kinase family protein [Acidobacteriaceae bacterium]
MASINLESLAARFFRILFSTLTLSLCVACIGCGGGSSGSGASPSVIAFTPAVSILPGGSASISFTAIADGPQKITLANLPDGITATPSSMTLEPGATGVFKLQASMSPAAAEFQAAGSASGGPGTDSITKNVIIQANGASGSTTASANVSLLVSIDNSQFMPAQTYLPVLKITTDGGAVIGADDYVTGSIEVQDPKNAQNNYTGTITIKGHGNTTWAMPKKPYTLKLDSKAPLLGMPSSKSWILLANYDDKSLLRNALAFELADRLGQVWAPRSVFVEIFLNAQYEGVYELTEKIDIAKNRLNITEMDDTDNSGKDLTGGYLLEIDVHRGEDFTWLSPGDVNYGIDDPDPATGQQSTYIENYVNTAEAALYSANFTDPGTGWPAYWDADSMIQWYLDEELMGNNDSVFWSSIYLYKDRNDPRLYMGPVWDFDISAGNVNYNPIVSPTQPWLTNSFYVKRLLEDPAFKADVKTKWAAVKATELDTLPAWIDQEAAALQQAQQNNFQRWPILGEYVWPNSEVANTYPGEVTFLKSWITQRVAWMDTLYGASSGQSTAAHDPGTGTPTAH